ncbi:MAG: hypothetical protein GY696_01905 [Gammaproteobacteria bacterium]|nr:hypothetical protein [Gammaproteobacteria bacterium]
MSELGPSGLQLDTLVWLEPRRPKTTPRGRGSPSVQKSTRREGTNDEMCRCKGGGEGYMPTIPSNQHQNHRKGDAQRKEGVQPWKTNPFLQLSETQHWQLAPNSARMKWSKSKDPNQWKARKTVITNYIMASCVIVLLMLSETQFTACDVLPAVEEQQLGKTFEVLT